MQIMGLMLCLTLTFCLVGAKGVMGLRCLQFTLLASWALLCRVVNNPHSIQEVETCMGLQLTGHVFEVDP